MARILIILMHNLTCVALVSLYAGQAAAHEWYEPSCCSEQDCAPIPRSSVIEGPDGYKVDLKQGQHPMVTYDMSWLIPYDEVHGKSAPDGEFHACIHPDQKYMICFHTPHRGY